MSRLIFSVLMVFRLTHRWRDDNCGCWYRWNGNVPLPCSGISGGAFVLRALYRGRRGASCSCVVLPSCSYVARSLLAAVRSLRAAFLVLRFVCGDACVACAAACAVACSMSAQSFVLRAAASRLLLRRHRRLERLDA